MPGGGGGADLDVITVGASDVLAGKVIVDKDGNPLTGTMPERGAVSAALNAGGSYTIPDGHHNGSGKITANSLASQTSATASAAYILSGQTAWVNGNKVTGSIPIQGADVSGTDRAWATNISCWEGVACLGVRNTHYMNGVNWIQGNIPNFYAGNIKKGVNMGGLVGTFEGYVPTPTDLYLRGNNISGWGDSFSSHDVSFDTGQISINSKSSHIQANLNLTGYRWFNVEGYKSYSGDLNSGLFLRLITSATTYQNIANISLPNIGQGPYTYSFDLTAEQLAGAIRLSLYTMNGAVYRMWLS